MSDKVTVPPPRGWVSRLAELAKCDRNTVRLAIYKNQKGVKSEKVRQLYKQLYGG